MNQQNHNFQSDTFRDLMESITRNIPALMFFGIVITYIVTAALNVHIIPLPAYIAVPAAAMIQFGRFAVVFMDFLNPTGYRSKYPPAIATVATVVALVELGFSVQDIAEASAWSAARYWSVYLFGAMLIGFGYILELNFIAKGVEAYGMKTYKRNISLDVTPQSRPITQRNAQPAIITAEKQRPQIMQELRERQQAQQNQERAQEPVETSPVQQPGTDVAAISSAIKSQQASLRAYRHKAANGIGKPETNEAGIARATAEIKRLQALLPG
jgi:hypothetical protein